MVLDIALARYDNTTPFGFKMVGGADFDVPLQVVRILPGSIAEEVGMSIGDVVVRINDIPTSNLSYYDAHQLLACAGNRFVLGILRAREIPPQQRAVVKERTPGTVGEVEYINRTPKPFWTPSSSANTNYLSDQPTTTTTTEEREIEEKIPDVPITDEQIAEIMSGEAEVLKQHNIIGVNFNKMIPTAGVFKQSEVFKTLNSELVQTEDEEGDKKWTTFMQKPSRPPPNMSPGDGDTSPRGDTSPGGEDTSPGRDTSPGEGTRAQGRGHEPGEGTRAQGPFPGAAAGAVPVAAPPSKGWKEPEPGAELGGNWSDWEQLGGWGVQQGPVGSLGRGLSPSSDNLG